MLGRDHEPFEARLETGALMHHGLDHTRHLLEDRLDRAVVHREGRDLAAGVAHLLDEGVVGGQIGIAPAVDRLLRVSDQEQARALCRLAFEGKPAHDLALQGAGVLKLVDQQLIQLAAQPATHLGTIAQQGARGYQKGFEADDATASHGLVSRRDKPPKRRQRLLESVPVALDKPAQARGHRAGFRRHRIDHRAERLLFGGPVRLRAPPLVEPAEIFLLEDRRNRLQQARGRGVALVSRKSRVKRFEALVDGFPNVARPRRFRRQVVEGAADRPAQGLAGGAGPGGVGEDPSCLEGIGFEGRRVDPQRNQLRDGLFDRHERSS